MSAWTDASTATYTAETLRVNDLSVTVCLDDEGPLRPAFYWDVHNSMGAQLADGWASSVKKARADALLAAKRVGP